MPEKNRGNRDPLMVLALHPRNPLSVFPLGEQNHERVPISPISPILVAMTDSPKGEVPKP